MSLFYRIQHTHDAIAWEGDFPITSQYTVGIAGEKFFRAIKDDEKLLGTHCPQCEIVYVPPRLYCEQCFDQLDEWLEVPNSGHVHTFTVIHLDLDGNPLPEPRILAFIRLDGTDGGLVHYLGEVEPEEVGVGLPVEAVFKDKKERQGGIMDIEYFKPA